MKGKVDHSINKQAIKALVAVYGQREAARQSGVPMGTVFRWSRIYGWKKLERSPITTGHWGDTKAANKDPATMLMEAMANHREQSALHLAKYAERAAKKASSHKQPLEIARQVRDVAQVHRIVHPPEMTSGIVEESILIGTAKVTDNLSEMLQENTTIDVREDVSDQRPAGH